jgi:hypothetical protein
LVKTRHLGRQKACRLHRSLVAVIKIAGNHESIDTLRQAKVHYRTECLSAGITNELGKFRISECERAQWRIEMDVGRMNKSKCHRGCALQSRTKLRPVLSKSWSSNPFARDQVKA